MRKNKRVLSLLSFLLLVSLLLSLVACGERGSERGRSSGSGRSERSEKSSEKESKKENSTQDSSESSSSHLSMSPDAFAQDATLAKHKNINTTLNEPEAEPRRASRAVVYLENTRQLRYFFGSGGAGGFQLGLRNVYSAVNRLFSSEQLSGFCLGSREDSVTWVEMAMDDNSRSKSQLKSFYSYGDGSVNYLGMLTENSETVFAKNSLNILVSPFTEPGFDLSGLNSALDRYMRENSESAVCLYGALSDVATTDLEVFRFNKEEGEPNFTILGYSGQMPYYILAVGPEQSVRDFDSALSELMSASSIPFGRGLFSNMVYTQLNAQPLTMTLIDDPKIKKSSESLLQSYNSGNLSEDPEGNIYYATYKGIETKDDKMSSANLSYTSQIACISKNLDIREGQFYTADFTLYAYDATTGEWTPCDKLASSYVTLSCRVLKGSSEEGAALLARDDEQLYVAAKLDFSGDSPLEHTTTYRVEVRLKLNYDNPSPFSEGLDSSIWDFSISDMDYYRALENLLTSTGYKKPYIKTWFYSKQRSSIFDPAKEALEKTPNLESLLLTLQNAENYTPQADDKLEYFDFIFNVNDGSTRKE